MSKRYKLDAEFLASYPQLAAERWKQDLYLPALNWKQPKIEI